MTNDSSGTSGCCRCTCLPYKDPFLITAQSLSILSLGILWTNWVTFWFNLIPFIMLQVIWCCAMNKSGLITIGVFCSVSGALAVSLGIYMLVDNCNTYMSNIYCYDDIYGCYDDVFMYSDRYSNGAYYMYGEFWPICYETWTGVLQLIGAIIMAGAAVCTFLFVCGPRYEKFHGGDDANNDNQKGAEATAKAEDDPEIGHAYAVPVVHTENVQDSKAEGDPEAVVVLSPVVMPAYVQTGTDKKKKKKNKKNKEKSASDTISLLSMGSIGTGSSTTKTITTLPDGSIKTETETVRPDGSRVITTTIENPMEE